MKETGIIYGSSSGKTESAAMKIFQKIGSDSAVLRDIADVLPEELRSYKLLILGVPTWGIGELQDDWSGFIGGLSKLDLSGIKVALFGLGDQESYPGTFADALGKLHDLLKHTGCEFIGGWPAAGYDFRDSEAIREGMFTGLVLDEENQQELTEIRIDEWLREILPGAVVD